MQVVLSLLEEKTIQREFGNLQKIKNNNPKMVITMDTFSGNTFDGIAVIYLKSFLNNHWK